MAKIHIIHPLSITTTLLTLLGFFSNIASLSATPIGNWSIEHNASLHRFNLSLNQKDLKDIFKQMASSLNTLASANQRSRQKRDTAAGKSAEATTASPTIDTDGLKTVIQDDVLDFILVIMEFISKVLELDCESSEMLTINIAIGLSIDEKNTNSKSPAPNHMNTAIPTSCPAAATRQSSPEDVNTLTEASRQR